ncbi:hypothetical protein [Agreia sp. COWG]|uniref:hypothetical protein n=1 Tax=Agreia sp. COWG TaxID=2773266 RepID=UPI0019252B61|nr:hypothetical protein [Agreia sp. COWG]CAD5991098.1 conserved protein of unknown function [Agreia sp. COWG]
MSDTKNTGPASPLSEGVPRGRRRWVPIALVGVAVLVILAVIIAWTTGAANVSRTAASGTVSPSSSSTTGATSSAGGVDLDVQSTTAAGSTDALGGDSGERATSEPHPFDAPADIAEGVTATVGSITSVQGVASGVGETAGPAIRFEVTITNNGTDAIDLALTTVLVDYGAELTPGNQMSGNTDTVAFPASLGAGRVPPPPMCSRFPPRGAIPCASPWTTLRAFRSPSSRGRLPPLRPRICVKMYPE